MPINEMMAPDNRVSGQRFFKYDPVAPNKWKNMDYQPKQSLYRGSQVPRMRREPNYLKNNQLDDNLLSFKRMFTISLDQTIAYMEQLDDTYAKCLNKLLEMESCLTSTKQKRPTFANAPTNFLRPDRGREHPKSAKSAERFGEKATSTTDAYLPSKDLESEFLMPEKRKIATTTEAGVQGLDWEKGMVPNQRMIAIPTFRTTRHQSLANVHQSSSKRNSLDPKVKQGIANILPPTKYLYGTTSAKVLESANTIPPNLPDKPSESGVNVPNRIPVQGKGVIAIKNDTGRTVPAQKSVRINVPKLSRTPATTLDSKESGLENSEPLDNGHQPQRLLKRRQLQQHQHRVNLSSDSSSTTTTLSPTATLVPVRKKLLHYKGNKSLGTNLTSQAINDAKYAEMAPVTTSNSLGPRSKQITSLRRVSLTSKPPPRSIQEQSMISPAASNRQLGTKANFNLPSINIQSSKSTKPKRSSIVSRSSTDATKLLSPCDDDMKKEKRPSLASITKMPYFGMSGGSLDVDDLGIFDEDLPELSTEVISRNLRDFFPSRPFQDRNGSEKLRTGTDCLTLSDEEGLEIPSGPKVRAVSITEASKILANSDDGILKGSSGDMDTDLDIPTLPLDPEDSPKNKSHFKSPSPSLMRDNSEDAVSSNSSTSRPKISPLSKQRSHQVVESSSEDPDHFLSSATPTQDKLDDRMSTTKSSASSHSDVDEPTNDINEGGGEADDPPKSSSSPDTSNALLTSAISNNPSDGDNDSSVKRVSNGDIDNGITVKGSISGKGSNGPSSSSSGNTSSSSQGRQRRLLVKKDSMKDLIQRAEDLRRTRENQDLPDKKFQRSIDAQDGYGGESFESYEEESTKTSKDLIDLDSGGKLSVQELLKNRDSHINDGLVGSLLKLGNVPKDEDDSDPLHIDKQDPAYGLREAYPSGSSTTSSSNDDEEGAGSSTESYDFSPPKTVPVPVPRAAGHDGTNKMMSTRPGIDPAKGDRVWELTTLGNGFVGRTNYPQRLGVTGMLSSLKEEEGDHSYESGDRDHSKEASGKVPTNPLTKVTKDEKGLLTRNDLISNTTESSSGNFTDFCESSTTPSHDKGDSGPGSKEIGFKGVKTNHDTGPQQLIDNKTHLSTIPRDEGRNGRKDTESSISSKSSTQ